MFNKPSTIAAKIVFTFAVFSLFGAALQAQASETDAWGNTTLDLTSKTQLELQAAGVPPVESFQSVASTETDAWGNTTLDLTSKTQFELQTAGVPRLQIFQTASAMPGKR